MTVDCSAWSCWEASDAAPKPDVSFVPPLMRRRLTMLERAALAVAWPVRSEQEIPVVFASRWGEIGVTLDLMRQFHAEGEMSPAGFSASVHNAAPGVFSLLTKNHAPYTAIAAGARSLESGILEALALQREVLFVYAEEATPEMYRPHFADVQTARAVAARLVPCAEAAAGAVEVAFTASEQAPLTYAAWVDFLAARTHAVATAHALLRRVEGA